MCETHQIQVSQRIFYPAYSSVRHDVLESPVLEHAGLRIGALGVGRVQVVVEVVVVEGEVNCSAVHTADGSKKTVVVVVVVVAVVVVVGPGSDSKAVDSKLIQIR